MERRLDEPELMADSCCCIALSCWANAEADDEGVLGAWSLTLLRRGAEVSCRDHPSAGSMYCAASAAETPNAWQHCCTALKSMASDELLWPAAAVV